MRHPRSWRSPAAARRGWWPPGASLSPAGADRSWSRCKKCVSTSVPVQAALASHCCHPRDLAFAKRRHAGNLAGEPAAAAGPSRSSSTAINSGTPKASRNRACHKLIGGRDDQHLIARLLVLPHQCQCLGLDGGLHHRLHELACAACDLAAPWRTNGRGGKAHVLMNIERAGLVMGIKCIVAPVEFHRIGPAEGVVNTPHA